MRRPRNIMKQIVKLLTLMCRKAHLPALLLMALLSGLATHADVVINETTFPDENFRNFILRQSYGADGLLTDAEIASVKSIDCDWQRIGSITGIEHFTALETLHCYYNHLQSLDLSKNTALRRLYAAFNNLKTIDVSKNTELRYLNLYSNLELSKLDVTNNKKLTYLQCSLTRLPSLDLSQNTELDTLDVSLGIWTELDFRNNTKLSYLNCSNNPLTSLDVSQNTELKKLYCNFTNLTSLDVTNNKKLNLLYCSNSPLTSLDLSQNPLLTNVRCHKNQLTELDLTNNTNLDYLEYYGQTRELTAESGITPDGERFYYLRLDDNNDNDKSIWRRMTETNFGGVTSKFDLSRVLEWTTGGTVVNGQKRVATTAGSLNPKDVRGKILLLTDVIEDSVTKTASGTVSYKYNVNNSVTPEGDTEFTLKWSAPFYGTTPDPTSLELNENLIRLQLTQSYQLEVETPNAGEITWTSSNPEVVQVDSTGRVTALKNGTAIVKATTANGLSARCGVWSYLRGDLNEDNKVDVADMNEELNIILTQ